MFFYERLKGLREDKDLHQEDLAKILNISRTALSNYETGYREPSLATLVKIADYFNISLDYLLCRTDEYKPFK
jgi:transcriptional regulator with XRE-family HTH domain